jgi:DNA topoisomerase-1
MRFVASQMTPAVFDQTTIDVEAKGKDGAMYLFRATGSVEKFDGFLKVYEEGKDQKDEDDDELKQKLPVVTQGETLRFRAIQPDQHFTEPPPRFTEATLVKELESDGVGRPSTYASILSTIQEREYVRKEGGKFIPTELGMVVTDLLLESFSDLFDVTYTARMEAELDEIEDGKLDWRTSMGDFYERFEKDLDHAARNMTDIKRMERPTDLVCEKCGKPMVIKWGRHGSFIACTGYPECTNTRELTVDLPDIDKADISEQDATEYCENCGRPMVLKKGRFGQFLACTGYPDCKTTKQLGAEQKPQDVPLDEKCPQCSSNMVRKYGRYGEFVACSNYPKCKYVKQKTIGVKCPNCSEGEVVERRSKRGKTFYGCNRYPDCDFVAWGKPIPEKCPDCGSSYLIEKYPKAGPVAQCPNGECKFKKPLPVPVEVAV